MHIAITFILIILAVSIIDTDHFDNQLNETMFLADNDAKQEFFDKVNSNLKCCLVSFSQPGLPSFPTPPSFTFPPLPPPNEKDDSNADPFNGKISLADAGLPPIPGLILPNSCCADSQLTYVKDTEKYICKPADAYKENCGKQFLRKQKGFRAAAVITLTLAIIFQFLLSFSIYNSQID